MNNETPESFFKYMEAVLVSDLTTTERMTALAYAKSYNWTHENESRVGNYRIAAQVGCNEKTVVKVKGLLTEKGWITSKRRFQKSNLTVPTIPAGFDYETEKAKQDALVESQNAINNERAQKSRKTAKDAVAAKDAEIARLQALLAGTVLEAPETPSEESGTLEHQEQENEPQTAVQSLTEASESQTDEEILAEDVFEEVQKKTDVSGRMDYYRNKLTVTPEAKQPEKKEEVAMENEAMNMNDFLAWTDELSELGQEMAFHGLNGRSRDSFGYIKATVLEGLKKKHDEWGGNANMRYTYAQKEVVFEGVKTRAAQKKELVDEGMMW